MVGKFCGKIAPSPIISSGSQLLIKFVSDYETHGAGFSFRYEVLKTGVWWCVASQSHRRNKRQHQLKLERERISCSRLLHAPPKGMNHLIEVGQFKFACRSARFPLCPTADRWDETSYVRKAFEGGTIIVDHTASFDTSYLL